MGRIGLLSAGLGLWMAGGAGLMAETKGTPLVAKAPAHSWAIVMHGGAGVIERASMKPETEAAYKAGMDRGYPGGGDGA